MPTMLNLITFVFYFSNVRLIPKSGEKKVAPKWSFLLFGCLFEAMFLKKMKQCGNSKRLWPMGMGRTRPSLCSLWLDETSVSQRVLRLVGWLKQIMEGESVLASHSGHFSDGFTMEAPLHPSPPYPTPPSAGIPLPRQTACWQVGDTGDKVCLWPIMAF